MSTAFEDYDKNTLENLQSLLSEGKVIGETYRALQQYGKLVDKDKLYYKIPFPVAMDNVIKTPTEITEDMIKDFIEVYFHDYGYSSQNERKDLESKVKVYLQNKKYSAETFEMYRLRGTPSSIIIDSEGILRYSFFGSEGYLEGSIIELMENR